jgi:eukaryotic-like serine/threonine-protein kinase
MAVAASQFDVLEPGDVVDGNYVCEEIIGRGGFAEVYRVINAMGRRLALKTLRAARLDDLVNQHRMAQEIAILNKVRHPNIVAYEDCGVHGNHLYVVTELLVGKTLRDHLISRGALPIEEALRIAVQIGNALCKAHELDIVHRDVKPENVVVLPNGVVKVLDFGIARQVARPMGTTRPVGTAAYMAPDQAENTDPSFVDKRWDVFQLALVLWEMIAGYHPRRGPEGKELAQATIFQLVLTKPMPSLGEVSACPAWLAQLVMTGLARDPNERWQSMGAFVRALDEALDRHSEQVRPLAAKLPQAVHDVVTETIGAMNAGKRGTPPPAPAVTPPAVAARGPTGTVRMPVEQAVDPAALAAAQARRRPAPADGPTEPIDLQDELPAGVPLALWPRIRPFVGFERDELLLLVAVFVVAMAAREVALRFL